MISVTENDPCGRKVVVFASCSPRRNNCLSGFAGEGGKICQNTAAAVYIPHIFLARDKLSSSDLCEVSSVLLPDGYPTALQTIRELDRLPYGFSTAALLSLFVR
ncbi:hypothetical protein VTO42DRAFT_5800 [Malbranchea cinnamomea]